MQQDPPLIGGRPYLGRGAQRVDRGGDAGRLDIGKLLGSSAPVTWGALLVSLPANIVGDLVDRARAINQQLPSCSAEEAGELAAVESALSTQGALPQNMFAPFTTSN